MNSAIPLDDQIKAINDEGFKKEIGKALGSDINIGFAGAVGKTFDGVIKALTSGSMVQKAQTLINFAENFLAPGLKDKVGLVLDRVKENLKAAGLTDTFRLDDRIAAANAPKAKANKAINASPEFNADFKALSTTNAGVDLQRQGGLGANGKPVNPLLNKNPANSSENTHLGGEMDTKAPQIPVELLSEPQLDFLSQQAKPNVDLTIFNAVMLAAVPPPLDREGEPAMVDGGTIRQLARQGAPLPGAKPPAGESDARWLWGLALGLLMLETVVRRRGAVKREAEAHADAA